MKRKPRKSCDQYISDRAAANRDRQIEETFSDLEREALRDRLEKLTPDREKGKP